jgi:hypothetical protein
MNLISALCRRGILEAIVALTCTALLVDSAAAGAVAASPVSGDHHSSQRTAAELPGPRQHVDSGHAATKGARPLRLSADFRVRRLSLIDGHVTASQGRLSEVPLRVGTDSTVDQLVDDAFHVDEVPNKRLYAAVAFQIEMQGKPSGYWIESIIGYLADCTVFVGDPSHGGKKADVAPFTCWAKLTVNGDSHKRFFFNVEMNRWSEASGTIQTQGDISLINGAFRSDQIFQTSGSKTVPPNGRTNFDAVLREGDPTKYENQARTEFSYKLKDGSSLSFLWVAGVAANYRGVFFSGESRCAVYDSNPLGRGRPIDQIPPAWNDYGYKCSVTGHYVRGPGESGNGHYHAIFTIYRNK